MDNLKIGSFLQALRKAKGLTQSDVAEYFQISNKTVSKWECGSALPEIPMLKALAEYYDVTVDEILNGSKASKGVESLEKSKRNNEDYFINQKKKKLDFWMMMSFIILAFGFIMVYILGYTTSIAAVACFVSLGIYFVSIALFFVGKYMLGEINNDFSDEKVKILKNRRNIFYSVYIVSLIYVVAMSIIFYALPSSQTDIITAVPTITTFLLFNSLGLVVAACLLAILLYIKNINDDISIKINKIMNISYLIILSIFVLFAGALQYADVELYSKSSEHHVSLYMTVYEIGVVGIILIFILLALIVAQIVLFVKKPKLAIIPKLLVFVCLFVLMIGMNADVDAYKLLESFDKELASQISDFVVVNIRYTIMYDIIMTMVFFMMPLYLAFDIVKLVKDKKIEE